jgi:hypothetical protein
MRLNPTLLYNAFAAPFSVSTSSLKRRSQSGSVVNCSFKQVSAHAEAAIPEIERE